MNSVTQFSVQLIPLQVTIPLGVLACSSRQEASLYLLLSTIGHFSLFPLLFQVDHVDTMWTPCRHQEDTQKINLPPSARPESFPPSCSSTPATPSSLRRSPSLRLEYVCT